MRCHITDNKAGYVEFGPEDSGETVRDGVSPRCSTGRRRMGQRPVPLTVKDGKYFGRGIIDDKGTGRGMLFAMRRLMAEGFEPQNKGTAHTGDR